MTLHRITSIADYKQGQNLSKLRIRSKMVFRKKTILLGILRKRQRFDETRTISAVENCRRLVFDEVERYFIQKEQAIKSILPELINGKKSYSCVFSLNDLKNILCKTENIIKHGLFERFNRFIVYQITKSDYGTWIPDILSPIRKYQETKKQTILITSYMETLIRRTLSNSIELLINNSRITNLVCNIDISTIILPKLGINSGLEIMELSEEVLNRIGGALYSIKVGLVREMNHQIANIFYETHDLLLNSTLQHKIHSLEVEIAEQAIYEPILMEA